LFGESLFFVALAMTANSHGVTDTAKGALGLTQLR